MPEEVTHMYVLLEDDLGRLTLRRLWPWHRMLAGFLAARLDRQLAQGARPEESVSLAARSMRLTSARFRRDLAANLQRILKAAGLVRPVAVYSSRGVSRQPHVPLRRARISKAAPELAELAARLVEPGPVPVRGVAMVSQLLADGGGPLYREACLDDLGAVVERAARALTR